MEQFGILTLGSRLKRLSDFLFGEVQAIYNESDTQISSTYFPILRLLKESGVLGVVEISTALGVSHPAVSKQVNKMLKEGLLVKVSQSGDMRKTSLSLSQKASDSMDDAEPILEAIATELSALLESHSYEDGFLDLFTKIEKEILFLGLGRQVITQQSFANSLKLELLSENHGNVFYELNMDWLREYFADQIEEQDQMLLSDPFNNIVKKGGEVWIATAEYQGTKMPIGVFALKPRNQKGEADIELIKMAVSPKHMGKGVGRYMLIHAFRRSRSLGYKTLCLESARKLETAISLYRSFGFQEVDTAVFAYDRTDIYMEINLSQHN